MVAVLAIALIVVVLYEIKKMIKLSLKKGVN